MIIYGGSAGQILATQVANLLDATLGKLEITKFPDGEKYVGGWKSDRQHGRGAYIYPDGRSDKGIWKDGKLVQPGY